MERVWIDSSDINLKSVLRNLKSAIRVGAMLFALCSSAEAQQTGKSLSHRFPGYKHASGSAVLVEAFRQEMSKLGWIEGKNIAIEYRFAEQKPERLPELAADLVRLKVDLIVVAGTAAGVSGQERDHDDPHRDGERR